MTIIGCRGTRASGGNQGENGTSAEDDGPRGRWMVG